MILRAQITTHFQQATGGVPAISGVAVGAGGYVHQLTQIDPDVTVAQFAAIAVDRGVALLVALDVDLDAIGCHRHFDADGTGHIDHRALSHQAATSGTDCNLAASGQGDRTVLEIDATAADDLDPRLVGAVSHTAEVVETTGVERVR